MISSSVCAVVPLPKELREEEKRLNEFQSVSDTRKNAPFFMKEFYSICIFIFLETYEIPL